MRRELVDWAKGQLAAAGAALAETNSSAPRVQTSLGEPPPHAPLELSVLDQRWKAAQSADAAPDDDEPEPDTSMLDDDQDDGAPLSRETIAIDRPVSALQMHNRYLVTECDDGMVVIDQHALHERILYEHLREKVLAGPLESQRLLVPEPVDLAPAEAAAVLQARDVLGQLGLAIEPFGGDTVLVSSYPAMLANLPPAEVLRDLVEQLLSGGKQPERRDLLDSLLHMISCKAADQGRRSLESGRSHRLARTAAPGPRHAPLPARPTDGAGLSAARNWTGSSSGPSRRAIARCFSPPKAHLTAGPPGDYNLF